MFVANQYLFDMGPGQFLAVASDGDKTVLTLQSSSGGQQQSQQSSFVTGLWIAPPQAWEYGGIYFVRVQTQSGSLWLQAGRGQIGLGQTPPANAIPLQGRSMSAPPPPSMPEMPPMKPMEMPPMKPMEMRMGNMAMQMGDLPKMQMGSLGDPPKTSVSPDLQQENLRLREENLRLREELMDLRQQLWEQKRGG
jgi:hypothetical protein